MNRKILVVEDDEAVNFLLCTILQKSGYITTQAYSGSEGLLRLALDGFDLIILDLMLPGVKGETIIEKIKDKGIPILVISAKSSIESKVSVLNLGADDYISKPFDSVEVLARVNALLRRNNKINSSHHALKHKALYLNIHTREVSINNQMLALTKNEFEILKALMEAPNKVFSRQALYSEIWSDGSFVEDNTINVHVSNIRKKIKKITGQDAYIQTVWGIGFKLCE